MEIRRGIPASPGYAIGRAYVLEHYEHQIPERSVPQARIDSEVAAFRASVAKARQEYDESLRKLAGVVGESIQKILQSHQVLLGDPALAAEVEDLIRRKSHSAAYALSTVLRRKIKALENVGQGEWAARIRQDLQQVERTILDHLLGSRAQELASMEDNAILVAHDLTPAETARLDKRKIQAIVTDKGGKTSHTSLVASSLGIPAVVGLGNFARDVSSADEIVVDGREGLVFLHPDAATVKKYEALRTIFLTQDRQLTEKFRALPAATRDGVRIRLYANVEQTADVEAAIGLGADGIGLYRTEFLYLGRSVPPSEEEQYAAYQAAVSSAGGKPVTIRTLDLGADKLPVDGLPVQANPFLGIRAIRLCFEKMELLETQIRAILRVGLQGPVRMMVPMISTLGELLRVRQIVDEMRRQLRRKKIPFRDDLPVGIMVEVPAAALAIDQFMPHVDFVSIGTNDLIAYLMAVDRTNEKVANLFQPAHPSVIQVLGHVVQSSLRHGKEVSICGEMAGQLPFVPLLVGLGFRHLSVIPHMIPEIKRVLQAFSIEEAKGIPERVREIQDADAAEEFLRNELLTRLPELA